MVFFTVLAYRDHRISGWRTQERSFWVSVTGKSHCVGMSPIEDLSTLARRQHGVLHRRDVLSAGLSSRQLERLVGVGLLDRVGFETYVFAAAPTTWQQAVAVAVTSAGCDSAASHQTAAVLHGLTDRRPDVIEVVVPRWARPRAVEYTVHESLDLIGEDVIVVRGIRTTTPVRTVVDLGASAPWLVESALDSGLRRKAFDLEAIARFVSRVGRRGRRGVGVIRPLVEQRLAWLGTTESELEDLLRREWGDRLPPLVPQFTITGPDGDFVCRADFAFPDQRLRIELDSEAFHMDRPTFRRDRRQQNRTELLGWRTLRYTWWDLTGRPMSVVEEIQAASALS